MDTDMEMKEYDTAFIKLRQFYHDRITGNLELLNLIQQDTDFIGILEDHLIRQFG